MGLESELLVGVWVSGLVSYAAGSARPYNGQHGFFRFVVFIQASRRARDVTFTLDQAGHTYEDGNVGLKPTSLTITPESKRVAVIGLNGSGKTTLLQLLGWARWAATSGSVAHRRGWRC